MPEGARFCQVCGASAAPVATEELTLSEPGRAAAAAPPPPHLAASGGPTAPGMYTAVEFDVGNLGTAGITVGNFQVFAVDTQQRTSVPRAREPLLYTPRRPC